MLRPRIPLRALLAASALPLAACYADDGLAMDEATTTQATVAASATESTGDDAPTTSAADTSTTGDDSTTGEPADCYSTRDFFADRVWAPLMSSNCAMCHEPTGVAAEKGAKFRLLTAVYPGFIEANLENIKSLKGYEYEGIPLLLAKPTGVVDHGGGPVLDPDGELYDDVAELLVQLDDPVECPATPPSAAFPDVELLTPEQTLRKAALHLVGRLPSAEERAAVVDGGEPALRAALDVFMTEDAFYERLAEIYNDVFFTDTYLTRDGVGTLNSATPDWPNVLKYFDKIDVMPADQKARIRYAVSREPLSLVQYVVRNDLPFTDILLAPYTVFTPDSAFLYGVDVTFDDPADAKELKPGTLKVTRNGKELAFPHAGVLTSPMWLNRFPTTPTNRNRHRARKVYDQFLATDVLALASQAIDPAAGSTFANPTREGGAWTQVSRLGMPLVNEVVIGLPDKDKFNGSEPSGDGQFIDYVTHPTLPEVLEILFGGVGVVAPNNFPRTDLVTAFLTGIPGVNDTATPSEMLRLNTGVPATAAAAQNSLGAALCVDRTATGAVVDLTNTGCDPAGFPNGRRPGDDVTDLALRVAMGYLAPTGDSPAGALPFVDGAFLAPTSFAVTFPYLNTPRPGAP